MNVLAIDFGLQRIGTAVGSTESGIAFPRDVLINDEKVFEELLNMIEADSISQILVGMPFKRDGAVGDIDEELQGFVRELQKRTDVPLELVDERYSSQIAQRKMQEMSIKERDQKGRLDAFAAQVLLEEWLS